MQKFPNIYSNSSLLFILLIAYLRLQFFSSSGSCHVRCSSPPLLVQLPFTLAFLWVLYSMTDICSQMGHGITHDCTIDLHSLTFLTVYEYH